MKHKTTRSRSTRAVLEEILAAPVKPPYVLRLYVTGMTPRSSRAIANAKALCETYLAGHYDLRVIDVYQERSFICGDQVVALPLLIKQFPLPVRRVIGDLADTDGTLIALDLKRHLLDTKRHLLDSKRL